MPRKKVKVTSGTCLAATAYGDHEDQEDRPLCGEEETQSVKGARGATASRPSNIKETQRKGKKTKKTKNGKKLKEKSAEAKKALKQWEEEVKNWRDAMKSKESEDGNEIRRKAKTWQCDYGLDPQKESESKLGSLKLLPKACSSVLHRRKALMKYVPIWLKFHYCVFPDKCCFGNIEQAFEWPESCSFSLCDGLKKAICQLQEREAEVHPFIIQLLQLYLIDEKADSCTLTVNNVAFALKTITQDGLSSQMEPRQNCGRLSYGGSGCILIRCEEWGDAMIMRIRSKRAGVGYHDLVSDAEPKRMLHLHDEFVMETIFEFGFKRDCAASRDVHVSLSKNESSKVELPSFMQPLVLFHYRDKEQSLSSLSSTTPYDVLNQQNMCISNNTANRPDPLIRTNERRKTLNSSRESESQSPHSHVTAASSVSGGEHYDHNMIQHGQTNVYPSNEVNQNTNTANMSYNNIAGHNHSSHAIFNNDRYQRRANVAMSEHDESPRPSSESKSMPPPIYASTMVPSTTTFDRYCWPSEFSASYGNYQLTANTANSRAMAPFPSPRTMLHAPFSNGAQFEPQITRQQHQHSNAYDNRSRREHVQAASNENMDMKMSDHEYESSITSDTSSRSNEQSKHCHDTEQKMPPHASKQGVPYFRTIDAMMNPSTTQNEVRRQEDPHIDDPLPVSDGNQQSIPTLTSNVNTMQFPPQMVQQPPRTNNMQPYRVVPPMLPQPMYAHPPWMPSSYEAKRGRSSPDVSDLRWSPTHAMGRSTSYAIHPHHQQPPAAVQPPASFGYHR